MTRKKTYTQTLLAGEGIEVTLPDGTAVTLAPQPSGRLNIYLVGRRYAVRSIFNGNAVTRGEKVGSSNMVLIPDGDPQP